MSGKNTEIKVKKDIVLREEEEGAFLFDPDIGRKCYLNELGVDIWKSCRENRTLDMIIKRLSDEYTDIPREQIADDSTKFLNDLENLGFITCTLKEGEE